ncbi:MAG: leishmanolysin-related zinc metalloendopeptidase [Gemmatimonadaceae bacterium]
MLKRLLMAAVVLVAVASCKDAAPPVPASVVAISATTLPSAVVASVVATAPTFEVRTASGKAIKNVTVSVAVTAGGGSIANAPVKTLAGPTPIGEWTLGTGAGGQSVTVTVQDLAPVVFSLEATPGAPTAVVMVEGDLQRAPENGPIPNPIRVRVRDVHNNGVPGVTVTWAVDAGGGDLPSGTTSLSDATGVATAPTWTVGLDGSGEQGLTATVGALPTVRFTAVVQDPPASITAETVPPGSVMVGSVINPAPTFVVRDAEGNALSGLPVTITVTDGGGSVTGAPAVSAGGETSIGTWTVGTTPGSQVVTVAVDGVPDAVFATTTVVGPPHNLVVVEGGGQSALAGAALATAIRVRVRDLYNNPLPGESVAWGIAAGGGSLSSGENSVADGAGEATAPTWTLGRLGGDQALLAFSGSAQLVIPATILTAYPLELRYNGGLPAEGVQQAFTNAVNRIRATIVGALSAAIVTSESTPGQCVAGVTIAETVPTEGIIIYATVEPIDGAGGILGSAGPCYIRSSSAAIGPSLTVIGRMRFDSADLDNMLAQGTLESVILHEMLHVIGIGTLWGTLGLRNGTAPTVKPFFTGTLAKDACINDHGGGAFCGGGVPIEDCLDLTVSCGSGTINSHWKESVFRTELMTGFLNTGLNPFSKMTVQSLADMGYTANVLTADAYTVPPPSLMALLMAPPVKLAEPTGPIGVVTESGRVEPIVRPPDDH